VSPKYAKYANLPAKKTSSSNPREHVATEIWQLLKARYVKALVTEKSEQSYRKEQETEMEIHMPLL